MTQIPDTGGWWVVGYGNELRSDDGAGPAVARAVAAWEQPGVCGLACHQLTPELAEPLARAAGVIFVDAAVGEDAAPRIRELVPAEDAPFGSHTMHPGALLALARRLFGRAPPAWLVTLPVANLDHGDTLSPTARAGVEWALGEIRHRLRRKGAV